MAGKRSINGDGSVYQRQQERPDGTIDTRWEARLTLADGRRKSHYARTRQEASRWLAQARHERDTGLRAASDDRTTLAQYLTRWLATIAPSVKPRTVQRYELAVRVHLIPGLGRVRLSKLTAQQVQMFYSEKLASGLAAGTVAHLHAVLHRALDAAERMDIVPRNVCDRVTPPRAPQHEMHIFSMEEAQAILAAVEGDRLEALYVLALTIGARQGELLGARWADVNLDTGTLRIRATLHFDTGGAWRLASPKTERSRRVVELPPMAVEALRKHRARQLEERLALGEAWPAHDFIFCTPLGEPIRGTHLLERHFLPLLQRLGMPSARWHDLRHTYVSIAIAQGVPINKVSQMIGHSSNSMTMDVYAHILPSQGQEAAMAMERAFGARQVNG